MSEDNIENLPSIEDYKDNSDELPSVEDLITEQELPSVEAFIEEEKEEIKEEDVQIIDDAEGNPQIEVTDVIQAPKYLNLAVGWGLTKALEVTYLLFHFTDCRQINKQAFRDAFCIKAFELIQ